MAINDILSSVRSYVSMVVIFILGTLLVIIPVNSVNTLRSDDLITTFNMVKSDHIVSLSSETALPFPRFEWHLWVRICGSFRYRAS